MNNIDDFDTSEFRVVKYSDSFISLNKKRIIFLTQDITRSSASDICALLLFFNAQSSQEEITIYLHSAGGDAVGLINIYDTMQIIEAPIKTICIGKCYSAGAILLAAGSKGKRYAWKNSNIMIHGIQAIFPIPGHDMTNSINYYKFLEDRNHSVMKIMEKHTGHSLQKLKEDCLQDVWMDAKQALNYNIIDHII